MKDSLAIREQTGSSPSQEEILLGEIKDVHGVALEPSLSETIKNELDRYAEKGPYECQLVRELSMTTRAAIALTAFGLIENKCSEELSRAEQVFGATAEQKQQLLELMVRDYHKDVRTAVYLVMGDIFKRISRIDQRTNVMLYSAAITHLMDRFSEDQESLEGGPKPHVVFGLDKFRMKDENEFLGHNVVDQSLWASMRRLEEVLRDTDLFWREGGDEFGAAAEVHDLPSAAVVARKVLDAIGTMTFTAMVTPEQLANIWKRYQTFKSKVETGVAQGGEPNDNHSMFRRIITEMAPKFSSLNGLDFSVQTEEEFLDQAKTVLRMGRRQSDREKFAITVETGWSISAAYYDPEREMYRDAQGNLKSPVEILEDLHSILEEGLNELKATRGRGYCNFHDTDEHRRIGLMVKTRNRERMKGLRGVAESFARALEKLKKWLDALSR